MIDAPYAMLPTENGFVFLTETCLLRAPSGELCFVGPEDDGAAHAVTNLNNGRRKESDIDMVADLPVYDVADINSAKLLVTYRR